jgi:catechol 2,3-dioxygenase-like lactoylglutathione lyase family enzyme
MRLDHVALRVPDRYKTAKFFIDAFDYRLAKGDGLIDGGFTIKFDDNTKANCLILEPPEKSRNFSNYPWAIYNQDYDSEYHIPPDIFISDPIGDNGELNKDSIIGKWVEAHKGKGYIHHMAYLTDDVPAKMKEWQLKGYAEFTTDTPIICPGELTQVFSRPSDLTGIVYELIERQTKSFCQKSVAKLMISTKDFT